MVANLYTARVRDFLQCGGEKTTYFAGKIERWQFILKKSLDSEFLKRG
jgi:hypothetical protein